MAEGFGAGLGQVIGAGMASDTLAKGSNTIDDITHSFTGSVAPYNDFGASFLPKAAAGADTVAGAAGTQSYGDFMQGYTASPGAQYTMDQATEAQNNSAAARGKMLSGTNERALAGINEGIASTYANQAYGSYLQGNQQNFSQLETSLGNMFGAIGVGTAATGQTANVVNSQMNNQAAITQAQAKNDQSKGSGFGSMFSGLGSLAAAF